MSSGSNLRVKWLLTINPWLPCIIFFVTCYSHTQALLHVRERAWVRDLSRRQQRTEWLDYSLEVEGAETIQNVLVVLLAQSHLKHCVENQKYVYLKHFMETCVPIFQSPQCGTGTHKHIVYVQLYLWRAHLWSRHGNGLSCPFHSVCRGEHNPYMHFLSLSWLLPQGQHR